jgi:hypothetical protein
MGGVLQTIASSDSYTVAIDVGQNRIFLTNRGQWTDPEQISAWVRDVGTAIKLCKPGFTVLIDWTASTGIVLTDLAEEGQKLLIQGGMSRAARVHERETFLKHQMDRLSEKTGFRVKSFFDMKEAKAWLDKA